MKNYFKSLTQEFINRRNRRMLKNLTPSIITSNCTGGFIYHWLGLQFRSPFINLWLENKDFVYLLEHIHEIDLSEIVEYENNKLPYPVGVLGGVKIYFKHYKNFEEAKYKWIERVQRIDWNNMFIMFTNWDGDIQLALRFDALPFKNKVIFVDEEITELKNAFVIDKWKH